MGKGLISCFLLLLFVGSSLQIYTPPKAQRKQLQGPPSEFSQFVIPSPESVAQRADSALLPVKLSQELDSWTWTTDFPVDSDEELSIAILSPHEEKLQIWLLPAGETEFTLVVDSMFQGEGTLGVKSSGPFGIDGAVASSTTYTFFEPAVGTWKIKVSTATELPVIKSEAYAFRFAQEQVQAYLLIENKSPLQLLSHLNSYVLEEGQQVGVVLRVSDVSASSDSSETVLPAAKLNSIVSATLDIVYPSGVEVVIPMHDDGLNFDALANDGIYGASVKATTPGDYLARAIVTGKTDSGLDFYRTSQHLITVAPELLLINSAYSHYDEKSKMVSFLITVNRKVNNGVRAYAEVYGTNSQGKKVPVGWTSSIADTVDIYGHSNVLELDLASNWFVVADAKAPYTLENVVLQDKDSFVILSQSSSIKVDSSSTTDETNTVLNTLLNATHKVQEVYEITELMRYGPRPDITQNSVKINTSNTQDNGKLLLVHGYCSGPVWNVNDFTNAVVFTDYSQSRSNDQFARMILEFGITYNSYGIIAHSQGGLASLHLKTYYWSGLDALTKGRPIQTVGSPYRGCSLAGVLADLGWLFGFGCGSNFDLSRDGASLWYSKIPKFVGGPQDAVYYYTTRYVNNWWFFSNCVTAANLILSKPNDGTCELKYAMLDNGHGMSTVEGWCHASNMKYPAQTSDLSRNKEMNTYAGR